jgi:hypothetical protein
VETTPRDSYIVGKSFVVKVTIATILEIAVVNPRLCYAVEAEVIPAVAVVCARTHEGEVAQDDVA